MSNYTQLSNFKTSGLGGAQWPKLEPIPSANVKDYVNQYLECVLMIVEFVGKFYDNHFNYYK